MLSLRQPRWRRLGVCVVAGGLLGLARLEPSWAGWAAWAAIALLAGALSRPQTTLHALVGAFACLATAIVVGLPWLSGMNHALFADWSGAQLAGVLVGEYVVSAGSVAVGLGIAHGSLRRWLPVQVWLPAGWALGELIRTAAMTEGLEDWLVTQWQNPPVLHLLAWAGWWPTLIVCVAGAAAVGEAWARRSWRHAIVAALVGLALVVLPAPSRGPLGQLEHIGAVHSLDTQTLVAAPPRDHRVDLFVWPEQALDMHPRLAEGTGHGGRIEPLLPGSDARHILGVIATTPGLGRRNVLTVVRPDGTIAATRAKRLFMPMAERRAFGIGKNRYAPGHAAPVLPVDGHPVGAIVCGEVFSRSIIEEVRRAGARVLLVSARDGFLSADSGRQLALGVQVLRSVEFGLPSVRASHGGEASFVAADGTVLASSAEQTPGVLTWSQSQGGRDFDLWGRPLRGGTAAPKPPVPPDVAVLYSKNAPDFRTRCPAGHCSYHAVEDLKCSGKQADVVVLAGHGKLDSYLGLDVEHVVADVACFGPRLVVVDTCLGASEPLLSALADKVDATVVAAPRLVPTDGFDYGPQFFESSNVQQRAAAVSDPNGRPLLRWHLDAGALVSVQRKADTLDAKALGAALALRKPTCIQLKLPGAGPVLVPVAWKRLRGSTPPPLHHPHLN